MIEVKWAPLILKKSKNIKPAHNVVLCDMLPTKNHKLGLWSFSWENLHTYELSCTWFHRVQGEEVVLPSVFKKFKKKIKKTLKLYFKVNKKDLKLVFHFHISKCVFNSFYIKAYVFKRKCKNMKINSKNSETSNLHYGKWICVNKKHLAHLE